jgi:hypothetical protein
VTRGDKNGLGKSLPNYAIFLGKSIFLVEHERMGVAHFVHLSEEIKKKLKKEVLT